MKRLKSVLIGTVASVAMAVIFMVPAVTQAASYCGTWQDLYSNTSNCQSALYTKERGIMEGYGQTFGANDSLNRVEAVAVVLRSFVNENIYAYGKVFGSQLGFFDTPSNSTDWWYPYVYRAKQLGFINGYADGYFRAGNSVTRAEFAKMFLAASPKASQVWSFTPVFSDYWGDTDTNAWYFRYMAFVSHYGLFADMLNSCGFGKQCPNQAITRAEAAQFVFNYHKKFGASLGGFSYYVNPQPTPGNLATPFLSSPANATNYYYANFNGGKNNLQLFWGTTSGATKYDLMVNFYKVGQYGSNYDKTYTTTGTSYSIPAFDLGNVGSWGYNKISWKVRAYDANGNYKDSAQWYVMDNYGVQPNPPVSTPVLTAPSSGAVLTNFPRQTYFAWTAVTLQAGVAKYQLELGCDICNGGANYSNPYTYETTATSMYQTMTGDNTFRFRVRAVDVYGNAQSWSDYRYFSYKTAAIVLASPILNSPYNGYTVTGTKCDNNMLTLSWYSTPGAVKYYASLGNISSPEVTGLSYQFNPDYYANGTYNWLVTAYDANGNYQSSASRTVTIQQTSCSQLGTPVLSSPYNSEAFFGGTQGMTYNWNATPGAVKYDVMIGFGSGPGYAHTYLGLVNTTWSTNAAIYPTLSGSGSYYIVRWKVRAYDSNNNYNDSPEWTYRVYYAALPD